MEEYPTPHDGASIVLAFRLHTNTTLVLGSGPLAASRAFAALEANSKVVVLAKGTLSVACDEIQWRSAQGQLTYIDWDTLPVSSSKTGEERDIEAFESYLSTTTSTTTTHPIRFVCMTDTLSTTQKRTRSFARKVYLACRVRNIPVNTTDIPELCDFTFTTTHRFEDPETGRRTALQVGVTTNGHGCRLAGRVKREIVARLPKEIGLAVERVGRMRRLARSGSGSVVHSTTSPEEDEDELDENSSATTPNRPVPPRSPSKYAGLEETAAESTKRKINWVAQVSEYWSLSKLAYMSDAEMAEVLSGDLTTGPADSSPPPPSANSPDSRHALALSPPPALLPRRGRLLLVGSGPGHPSLLTLATHTALTQLADLVLSDKLVPAAVLALIPPHVPIKIARKFPGNADGAQEEMMREAAEAVNSGLCVIRLKQGDPQIYARTSEEVLFFRAQHNIDPLIVPGVSSALAGPTFAGISITQRGVAESVVVCTGVGRGGKEVRLPGYERGRTTVVLMGVARLGAVVGALLEQSGGGGGGGGGDESATNRRCGAPYPPYLPIAIIERASMPDQRVVTSTLRDVVGAMESVGEQRPPGMMVVGWAVLGVSGDGEAGKGVLDDAEGEKWQERQERQRNLEEKDEERVRKWLGGARWRVEEGIETAWDELESSLRH